MAPSTVHTKLHCALYSLVAELGLLDAHTVSRERWVLESRELGLRKDTEILKGGEQAGIVAPSCIRIEGQWP